jgi:hypothetical protein
MKPMKELRTKMIKIAIELRISPIKNERNVAVNKT